MVYPERKHRGKRDDSTRAETVEAPAPTDTRETNSQPGRNKPRKPRDRAPAPDDKPKNTKAYLPSAPPPQPKAMSTKATKPVNDPLAVDYMLGAEEAALMPVRTQKIVGVEFSSYPDLIESTYRVLSSQASHFSKTVPPSAFALYCTWYLHYHTYWITLYCYLTQDYCNCYCE